MERCEKRGSPTPRAALGLEAEVRVEVEGMTVRRRVTACLEESSVGRWEELRLGGFLFVREGVIGSVGPFLTVEKSGPAEEGEGSVVVLGRLRFPRREA